MLKAMGEVNVREGLKLIKRKMNAAALNRKPELQIVQPRLVAVSKTKPIEMIIECYEEGQRHFGENYVSELIDKSNNEIILEKCKDIRWHYIGHLQRNKINKILSATNLFIIETVDNEKVASNLNSSWLKFGKPDTKLKIMIQVNTSGEEEKSGVDPSCVVELTKYVINECPNLEIDGLMTIGKFGYDPRDGPNPDFLCLKKCRDDVCQNLNLDWKDLNLSMGMSDDYEHAIELGSTNVRVGSSIFGHREKKVN